MTTVLIVDDQQLLRRGLRLLLETVADVADIEVDAYRRLMAVNLDAVFYGLKYEIPALLEAGGGAIVNVSAVDVPPPGAGENTVTCAVPLTATSAAAIVARSCVPLTYVVGRAVAPRIANRGTPIGAGRVERLGDGGPARRSA